MKHTLKIALSTLLFLSACKANHTNLYSYKTNDLTDETSVKKLVNQLAFPQDASLNNFTLDTIDDNHTLIVTLKTNVVLTDADLEEAATLTFALLDDLDLLEYHEENSDVIAVFTRSDIDYRLKANGYLDTKEIGSSEENFNKFIESYQASNS